MTARIEDLDRLAFERFLDVVNRAILDSRGFHPYSAVLRTLQLRLARHPCLVSVVGTEPDDATVHSCVLDQQVFRWVPTTAQLPAARWSVRRQHIEDVLDAPWRYRVAIRDLEFPPFSLVRRLDVPFSESDSPETPSIPYAGVAEPSPPRLRRASY